MGKAPRFSLNQKLGLYAATAIALVSVGGMVLTLRGLAREAEGFVQQSLGDTAGMLALHLKSRLQSLSEQIVELSKAEADAAFFEADPELLDLAIWKRESHVASPVRAHSKINLKYISPRGEYPTQLQALLGEEGSLVETVFQNQPVARGESRLDPEGMIFIAVPVVDSNGTYVVSAHYRARPFKQAFAKEGYVQSALIDGAGRIIAYSGAEAPQWIPSFRARTPASLPSGQTLYTDPHGAEHSASFNRIGFGDLTVVASIPEKEASSGLRRLKAQGLIFLMTSAMACLGLALALGGKPATQTATPDAGDHLVDHPGPSLQPVDEISLGISRAQTELAADRRPITVLHGSVYDLITLMEKEAPENVVEAINDFLTLAASRASHYGGLFERYSGTSFAAVFGAPDADGTEAWRALRCALELRKDFEALNASRKINGHRSLIFAMGVDAGQGIAGRIGAAGQMHYTAVSPAHATARALDELAPVSGTDLLISQGIWQQAETHFFGESLGEAKLAAHTGLVGYYAIWGYRNEQGQEIRIETPYSRLEGSVQERVLKTVAQVSAAHVQPAAETDPSRKRWLVNNGSQIIGPLKPEEIASRLYSQELDFDSECWVEGTGNKSEIRLAGIFGPAQAEDATLWVFDGQTLHGPLSEGFLSTAVSRGALGEGAFVCEGSTVQGWVPVLRWKKENAASRQKAS